MTKFIIRWNLGYGDSHEVIEADSLEEAQTLAYQAWREEAENSDDYDCEEYTEEKAEGLGLTED